MHLPADSGAARWARLWGGAAGSAPSEAASAAEACLGFAASGLRLRCLRWSCSAAFSTLACSSSVPESVPASPGAGFASMPYIMGQEISHTAHASTAMVGREEHPAQRNCSHSSETPCLHGLKFAACHTWHLDEPDAGLVQRIHQKCLSECATLTLAGVLGSTAPADRGCSSPGLAAS